MNCIGANTYSISIMLSEQKENGHDWDSFNLGPYRNPDIDISINNKEISFKCKNTFYCDYEFQSNETEFEINIVEFDSLNKNDTIGSSICSIGSICPIGQANVKIERSRKNHTFGNCRPNAAVALAEKQAIKIINKLGSVVNYYLYIENCHYDALTNLMRIEFETIFIGTIQNYLNKTYGTLITNLEGSNSDYIKGKSNAAFNDLSNAIAAKNFIKEKRTNIIISPSKKQSHSKFHNIKKEHSL